MQKNLSTLKDEELISLCKEGNSEAEDIILRRYKNFVRIKSRTYFLIGADSDDIVQEGMIGLYKAVRDFNNKKNMSFKTFADICVTRQILTAIRTANRNKHSPLNTYLSIDKPVNVEDFESTLLNVIKLDNNSNPEELYISDESSKELKKAISDNLSEFEKTVINLYLEGCSYYEISEKINRSVKSVDNALQRIKKKLGKFKLDN